MKHYILSIALASLLAGCGGGGSSTGDTSPTNPNPPIVTNKPPTNVNVLSLLPDMNQVVVKLDTALDDLTTSDGLVYAVYISTDNSFIPSASTLVERGVNLKSSTIKNLKADTEYTVKVVVSDTQNASTTSTDYVTRTTKIGVFTLSSPVVSNGGIIPNENSCTTDGGGLSIPLSWANAPVGTKSFAVIMEDENLRAKIEADAAANPSYPLGKKLQAGVAWYVLDIPVSVNALPTGVDFSAYPSVNYYYNGVTSYIGACSLGLKLVNAPYKLKVYALSTEDLYGFSGTFSSALNTTSFEAYTRFSQYILGSAEMTVYYSKN